MQQTITMPEQKAIDLLDKHTNVDDTINPIKLAGRLGIKVVEAEFTDDTISGALQIHANDHNEKATIYVKHDDATVRKRFTIAHEIGHFLLHANDQTDFVDNQSTFFRNGEKNQQELEANDFAANLLMPRDRVLDIWDRTHNDLEFMSKYFGVSKIAMSYRLRNLGVTE